VSLARVLQNYEGSEARLISGDMSVLVNAKEPADIRAAGWPLGLERSAILFVFLFVVAQPISIAAAEAAFAGAAICWLARVALVGRRSLRSGPLDGFILAYWLLCGLSSAVSPFPGSSWDGMRKVALIFLVLVAAHNIVNRERTRQVLALLFLSGLVTVGVAAWQDIAGVGLWVLSSEPDGAAAQAGIRAGAVITSVDGHTLTRPEDFLALLRAKPSDEALQLRVVRNVPGSELILPKDAATVILPTSATSQPLGAKPLGMTLARARPPRARGFYSHFITYSDEMQMLLALAFGLWLASPDRFRFPALGLGVLAVTFGLTLGATLSRSAWLAAAIACLLQIGFYARRRWMAVVLPLAFVLAALGTNVAVRHWRGVGLIDPSDLSTQYRLLMWRDGLKLIRQHPVFGVGMNSIRDAWPLFDLEAFRAQGARSHFHSTPVQFAVAVGIPALLAWLALMAAYGKMLVELVGQARQRADPMPYGLSLGILGGSAGFLANSLVQYNFGDSVVVLLFWFLMGLALATRHHVASGGRASAQSALQN